MDVNAETSESSFEYAGKKISFRRGESFLEALLRHAVAVPYSCRNGVCNVCMSKTDTAKDGDLFTGTLPEKLVAKGYFLPCRSHATQGLRVEKADKRDLAVTAILSKRRWLSPDIFQLELLPATPLDFRPGQFIHVYHPDGDSRAYSLANCPQPNGRLELHIRLRTHGRLSAWMAQLREGEALQISQAGGNCYLRPAMGNLYLVAFGVGLSSLQGVLLDACRRSSADPSRLVELVHVVACAEDAYLKNEHDILTQTYPFFRYDVLQRHGQHEQTLDELAERITSAKVIDERSQVFISGNPESVDGLSSRLATLGVKTSRITTDPYEFQKDFGRAHESTKELPYPETSDELWQALGGGVKLKAILDDFYDAVFLDPRLSPFFQHFTKQRSKEKVYSFYRQIFSGEKVFFGDRPRNSHSWMVIDNELYDYRIDLLTRSMRRHNLPEAFVQKWLFYENYYRQDIVKEAPRGRRVGGVEQPAGGFAYEVLDEGCCCDSCSGVIDKGERVLYELRTGQVFCRHCHPDGMTVDCPNASK